MFRGEFYGYLISFLGILIASFGLLMGLSYWSPDVVPGGEVTCVTSSGISC